MTQTTPPLPPCVTPNPEALEHRRRLDASPHDVAVDAAVVVASRILPFLPGVLAPLFVQPFTWRRRWLYGPVTLTAVDRAPASSAVDLS